MCFVNKGQKKKCWDRILYWGVSVGIDMWVDKIILDQ